MVFTDLSGATQTVTMTGPSILQNQVGGFRVIATPKPSNWVLLGLGAAGASGVAPASGEDELAAQKRVECPYAHTLDT